MDPADVGAGAYIASVVILTNLAIGDVGAARFAWKSTSPEVKSFSKDLRNAWVLGKALYTRDFPRFFRELELHGGWQVYRAECVRARVIRLTSVAYTQVAVPYIAANLGLAADEALEAVLKLGWTLAPSGYLAPVPGEKYVNSNEGILSDLESTSKLTEYALALERKPLTVPGVAPPSDSGGSATAK